MNGKQFTARVMLGIPTLSTARRSTVWMDAAYNLQLPLGSSLARVWVQDKPVDEARNELCALALLNNIEYLVMLGDDVVPPPDMILKMLDMIGREVPNEQGGVDRIQLISGVYWTKTDPTEPYLWNGMLRGAHRAWRAGDFFPVDFAGCDALMIEVEALRRIPQPWFSRDWTWEPGMEKTSIATEDFYFYTRARSAGVRLYCDSSIQCLHEDRGTGHLYGLTLDMPQAGGTPDWASGELVADLGCGLDSPHAEPPAKVVRFDIRASVRPDVQCDVRNIPPEHLGKYDVVHARHLLEHLDRGEAPKALAHWTGLLKPGGRLVIRVPNIEFAMRDLLEHLDTPEGPSVYSWEQLYGRQDNPQDRHLNGFTKRKLMGLLRVTPGLLEPQVSEEDGGKNILGTAVYAGPQETYALGPVLRAAGWEEESISPPDAPAGSDSSHDGEGDPPPSPSTPEPAASRRRRKLPSQGEARPAGDPGLGVGPVIEGQFPRPVTHSSARGQEHAGPAYRCETCHPQLASAGDPALLEV